MHTHHAFNTQQAQQANPAAAHSTPNGSNGTAAQEPQARIAELERQLAQMVEISQDAFLVAELKDNGPPEIVNCNPAAVQLFNASSAADLVGHSPLSLSPAQQPDGAASEEAIQAVIAPVLETGSGSARWQHRTVDGAPIDCSLNLTLYEHDGHRYLSALMQTA
jgi:PAS domain-containing protein